VSGIEGNFRNTAQITMRVLRENKDSLMAVLEAFVYDPLISWRLTAGQEAHGGGGSLAFANLIWF
jgi:FKBP12-rapamycin complex-associated protein